MRLHRYLMLHTAAWASGILLIGALAILAEGHWTARRDNEALVDTLERMLEVQLLGITTLGFGHDGFPDWQVISRSLADTHGCARLRHPDGQVWRGECRGQSALSATVPRAFTSFYRLLFAPGLKISRTIDDVRGAIAELEWIPSAEHEIALAWRATRRLGGLIAITVLALGLVVFWLTARALRPTTAILDGLARLAAGERAVRLAPGRFEEVAGIAQAVNSLADALQSSETAQLQLANRLATAQEDERQQLARELHDEFGQHLTGIAGLAAALRHDHAADSDTARGARRIEEIVGVLHAQLRQLLATLRPPGLAELGLAGALDTLIREWSRQPGRPSMQLTVDGELQALSMPYRVHVYRIVQECLTNAVRHAGATRIGVRVARRPVTPDDRLPAHELLELEIDDDGPRGAATAAAGQGRRGIAERAAALRGRVVFDDVNPAAPRVHAWLPVLSDTGIDA